MVAVNYRTVFVDFLRIDIADKNSTLVTVYAYGKFVNHLVVFCKLNGITPAWIILGRRTLRDFSTIQCRTVKFTSCIIFDIIVGLFCPEKIQIAVTACYKLMVSECWTFGFTVCTDFAKVLLIVFKIAAGKFIQCSLCFGRSIFQRRIRQFIPAVLCDLFCGKWIYHIQTAVFGIDTCTSYFVKSSENCVCTYGIVNTAVAQPCEIDIIFNFCQFGTENTLFACVYRYRIVISVIGEIGYTQPEFTVIGCFQITVTVNSITVKTIIFCLVFLICVAVICCGKVCDHRIFNKRVVYHNQFFFGICLSFGNSNKFTLGRVIDFSRPCVVVVAKSSNIFEFFGSADVFLEVVESDIIFFLCKYDIRVDKFIICHFKRFTHSFCRYIKYSHMDITWLEYGFGTFDIVFKTFCDICVSPCNIDFIAWFHCSKCTVCHIIVFNDSGSNIVVEILVPCAICLTDSINQSGGIALVTVCHTAHISEEQEHCASVTEFDKLRADIFHCSVDECCLCTGNKCTAKHHTSVFFSVVKGS